MAGFTKLCSTIITSSIWSEDHATRIVWVTMLALADADGQVDASLPGLARAANVTLQECEIAVKKFSEPDPYSRTTDYEGRRLCAVDGGWLLLNYAKYRQTRDPVARKEQNREAAQKHRDKIAEISRRQPPSAAVSQDQPLSAHAEADAEAEKEERLVDSVESTATIEPPWSEEEEAFERARKLYPSTAKRGHATEWVNFRKKHKDWREAVADLEPAIRIQIRERELKTKAKEFVPPWKNFQTWINQRYWEQAYNAQI
jgi:hypothetical protein